MLEYRHYGLYCRISYPASNKVLKSRPDEGPSSHVLVLLLIPYKLYNRHQVNTVILSPDQYVFSISCKLAIQGNF